MMGIYKITNLINGKVYIGQSVNIYERWQAHIQLVKKENPTNADQITLSYPLYTAMKKYGIENFDFSIIEECEISKLDELEKYWIKYYNSYIYNIPSNGYNLTRGGQGFLKTSEDQIKLIIDLWNQGKSTGEIEEIVNLEKHTVLKYLKSLSNYTLQEAEKRGRVFNGKSHRKKINRYDENFNLVRTYESVSEAEKDLGIKKGKLSTAISGKYSTYNNEYFIYADVNQYEELLKRASKTNTKTVLQYDLQGNFINKYESATAAAKLLNKKDGSNIASCCVGKSKTAYGYNWKYEDYAEILRKKFNIHYTTDCGFASEIIKDN